MLDQTFWWHKHIQSCAYTNSVFAPDVIEDHLQHFGICNIDVFLY